MYRIDLTAYKKNGYKYNHIAVRFDCTGCVEYHTGYKSTLETYLYNGVLPADVEILTFRQAAAQYPEYFIFDGK